MSQGDRGAQNLPPKSLWLRAMAHPSTLARAQLARLLSAAVLPVASLLLSTCARDVTAPPAPTELAFIQQPGNVMAGHQISPAGELRAADAHGDKGARVPGNGAVALVDKPGGGTPSGTTTGAGGDGGGTLYDLSLDQTGTRYKPTARQAG